MLFFILYTVEHKQLCTEINFGVHDLYCEFTTVTNRNILNGSWSRDGVLPGAQRWKISHQAHHRVLVLLPGQNWSCSIVAGMERLHDAGRFLRNQERLKLAKP